MIFPVLLILGGAAALIALTVTGGDEFGPVPDFQPDLPMNAAGPVGIPMSTRYRKIDAILMKLKAAADGSGIPLGVLVGWIAKESGGRLDEITRLDERGLFQLMPSESKALGLDHARLSTDVDYSIAAGIQLIRKYMGAVDQLAVAPAGSSYFWKLVKLAHTVGSGAMRTVVNAAKAANAASSWTQLERWALDHERDMFAATKHSMAKWFPLVDAVVSVGSPFGFGSTGDVVVGGAVAGDIVDPLDCA